MNWFGWPEEEFAGLPPQKLGGEESEGAEDSSISARAGGRGCTEHILADSQDGATRAALFRREVGKEERRKTEGGWGWVWCRGQAHRSFAWLREQGNGRDVGRSRRATAQDLRLARGPDAGVGAWDLRRRVLVDAFAGQRASAHVCRERQI